MHHALPAIQIRKIIRREGGAWPFLLRDGLPLVLPNLWIDEIRLGGGHNTAEAYLRDLALIYRWGLRTGVCVESRLRSLQGFTSQEIQAVASELCTTRLHQRASKATCIRRFESIKSFINFGFDFYTELNRVSLAEQSQAEKNLNKQLIKLRRHIRRFVNDSVPGQVSTDLDDSELAIIEKIISPDSPENPFKSRSIRLRNYCIFHVAIEVLARRGELVLLEVDDVDLSGHPTITIKQPSDNNKFKRVDGASLKTRGRMVPISHALAKSLHEYLSEVRDDFLVPKVASKALFLSARDGRRLSTYTINQIIKSVAAHPEIVKIPKRLHPHGLRATGANLARRKLGVDGKISGVEVVEALSYIGGWGQDSPMVAKYSRAALSERLGALLRVEKKGPRKLEGHNDE